MELRLFSISTLSRPARAHLHRYVSVCTPPVCTPLRMCPTNILKTPACCLFCNTFSTISIRTDSQRYCANPHRWERPVVAEVYRCVSSASVSVSKCFDVCAFAHAETVLRARLVTFHASESLAKTTDKMNCYRGRSNFLLQFQHPCRLWHISRAGTEDTCVYGSLVDTNQRIRTSFVFVR